MLMDVRFGEIDSGMCSILDILSNGHGATVARIGVGLYVCGHWNFNDLVKSPKLETYGFSYGEYAPYGVCDSPEQWLEVFADLVKDPDRAFVVSFVRLRKDEQEEGGWRWHKWGEYIGKQSPQCEYLYAEPIIEEVFTYHFYEIKDFLPKLPQNNVLGLIENQ